MSLVAGDTQWKSQTFVAGVPGNLEQVDVFVRRVSTPGALTVQIQGVAGGVPSGKILASATVPESDVAEENAGWISVRLSPPAVVSLGTQYAIVLSAPTGFARPPSPRMYFWNFVYGDPYRAGRIVESSKSGSGWDLSTGQREADAAFKTYVTPAR